MTWILLRGLTREAGHWGDFLTKMNSAFGGERVIAIDLPGAGRLYAEKSPGSVAAIARHCRDQVERAFTIGQFPAPPYRLLGLSMGGMVAIEWARQVPGDIDTVVAINTSIGGYCPVTQRLRLPTLPTLLRLLVSSNAQQQEAAIFDLTACQRSHRDAVIATWVPLRVRHPVSRRNALRQLWAAASYRPTHPPAGPRWLLLSSRGDRLVSSDCSRALARAWQYDWKEHPWAGHDLPLDDGDWVIDTIGRWLERNRAPA